MRRTPAGSFKKAARARRAISRSAVRVAVMDSVVTVVGAVAERTLYRPMYKRPHLDHVLFSIGLVFMAVAAVDYLVGSQQQIIKLPEFLQGRFEIGGVGIGRYRLFIVIVCLVLTAILQLVLARTRFGSRLRAAVDDPRVAAGLGINVNQVFSVTFAVGSGLAGLGGALGADLLGLEPSFPLKYMVYFLIVCAVGGTSSITGPLLAALLLGCADVHHICSSTYTYWSIFHTLMKTHQQQIHICLKMKIVFLDSFLLYKMSFSNACFLHSNLFLHSF